jgi:ribosome biogenesis GTPase
VACRVFVLVEGPRRFHSAGILPASMEILDGTVIAVHGSLIRVQSGDRTLVVSTRRRLRWEGGKPESARLVVGDRVAVEMQGDDDGVVQAVYPRSSALTRRSPSGNRPQVLAANVDQALVVFAAVVPEPKPRTLDRFLVGCEVASIRPVIVINKIDQGSDQVDPWLHHYAALGYPVLRVSARTGWGMGQIKRLLPDHTSLFYGPSGAGKSSLLNAVYPGFRLAVGTVSDATGKGRHTTTRAELLPLPFGGFVVDSPGLKEFGVWNLERIEVEVAFPEIHRAAAGCRFPNCTHDHEPGCAVREAAEEGQIFASRYHSYLTMLEEVVP